TKPRPAMTTSSGRSFRPDARPGDEEQPGRLPVGKEFPSGTPACSVLAPSRLLRLLFRLAIHVIRAVQLGGGGTPTLLHAPNGQVFLEAEPKQLNALEGLQTALGGVLVRWLGDISCRTMRFAAGRHPGQSGAMTPVLPGPNLARGGLLDLSS